MQEQDRIGRIRTVLTRSALSHSTLYRKIEKGTFPKQVHINDCWACWRELEISRWIADPVGWRPLFAEHIDPGRVQQFLRQDESG